MNPQYKGRLFENEVHLRLKNITYYIQLLNETEIRSKYGSNNSAIDHLIETDKYIIFIQDKWTTKAVGCDQINHFIYSMKNISDKIFPKKYFLGIYLTNIRISKIAQKAFDEENEKMEFCFLNISLNNNEINDNDTYNQFDIVIDILLTKLHQYFDIFSYDTDGSIIMR
jgi:hypothetical protein